MAEKANRYEQIIESIFFKHYAFGAKEVPFQRTDIVEAARRLDIKLPKNLGDVLYSFRYRSALSENIARTAPEGFEWVILPAGRALYKFALTRLAMSLPPLY